MTSSIQVPPKKAFYRNLWIQVLAAVAIAIVLGYVRPDTGVAMRPLGDAFIRLISMVISLVIFCTVVTGIAFIASYHPKAFVKIQVTRLAVLVRTDCERLSFSDFRQLLEFLVPNLAMHLLKSGTGRRLPKQFSSPFIDDRLNGREENYF